MEDNMLELNNRLISIGASYMSITRIYLEEGHFTKLAAA